MALSRTTDLIYENNVAPTAGDNFASGFKYGDDWRDTVTGIQYNCIGDGVWVNLTDVLGSAKKANLNATTAPTVNDDIDLGYEVGSTWVDTTADKAYICVDNGDGVAVWIETTYAEGAGGEMKLVQAKKTTSQGLTITPTNINFDTTELENDPTVIDHDSVNTERVYLLDSCYYLGLISLSITSTDNADVTVTIELYKNNTTLLSTLEFVVDKQSTEVLTRPFILPPLTPGDYLNVKIKVSSGSSLTLNAGTRAQVIKLEGIKGDKGATGAGSNVIIQKDDATVGTVMDTINFEGDLTLTDEGGGKVTVLKGESHAITGAATISGTSYTIERRFVYGGSNKIGLPSKIFLNAWRTSGTGTFDLRIVRGDNAQVVCQVTVQSNTDDSVLIDMGVLSNLPTTRVVLEVQGRVSSGTTTGFLGGIYFEK